MSANNVPYPGYRPGDCTHCPRAWLQYYRQASFTGELSNIPIPMPQTMGEVARLLDLLKIQVP